MTVNNSSINLNMNNLNMYKSNQDDSEQLKKDINLSTTKQSISMNAIFVEINLKSQELERGNSLAQSIFSNFEDDGSMMDFLSGKELDSEGNDIFSLSDLGYTGKPITELTQEEASALVSEDGFFGVEQTSSRSIDFVLSFAGDDIELLKEGRAGMVEGFKQAEELWGGKLPDISYETQEKILEAIDAKIEELGGSVVDTTA
jgi:hypothetical protein